MKGPGLRVDNDVRRVWVCPACGARSRADGDWTSLKCGCRPEGAFMRLEEGRRQTRRFEIPRPDETGSDPSQSHREPGADPPVLDVALVERDVEMEVEREIAVVAEAQSSSENESTPETEAKNSPEALPSGDDAPDTKSE